MPRAVSNPPNPWHSTHTEWLGEPPAARLRVFEQKARSALSHNDSPDIPFRHSVNPYRGCQHGCAYCFARPTHEFLDLGAGTDFEKTLIVKTNIAEQLRRELFRKSWSGEVVTFSGVTDCYQALEAAYGLTRECLAACLEARTPVAVITKSALVRRDADLLRRLHREAGARVFFSIPFLDREVARVLEPGAPAPSLRFAAMRALAEADIPVGISIAPLIPGLNEADIPELLERAGQAGARTAFLTLLHLSGTVEAVFKERLETGLPRRAPKVFQALADMRAGRTRETRFGERMHGRGPRWQAVRDLFQLHCRRHGLRTSDERELDPLLPPARPVAPPATRGPQQGQLFPETP